VPATAIHLHASLSEIRAVSRVSSCDATPPIVAVLTRRLAAGDEAAFREFHAQYFDRLYRFLLVVTRGQEHAAQDALQETLLRVAKHAREFADEEIFWGWLKAIARNAARDGGRKQRRYLALLARFLPGVPREAAPEIEGTDPLRTLLADGLATLEPLDRRLIESKYLQGFTVAELASDTHLTEKAVESRLLRLRRQLADTLLKKLRTP
jgi:RNA polymerase sigma-70 factor (ECF subfamily)